MSAAKETCDFLCKKNINHSMYNLSHSLKNPALILFFFINYCFFMHVYIIQCPYVMPSIPLRNLAIVLSNCSVFSNYSVMFFNSIFPIFFEFY